MNRFSALLSRIPIRWRVPVVMALAIALVGGSLVAWNEHAQRQAAIAQARAFADSVHQLTLAGLTAMMISGAADRSDVFTDQIRHANDIRSLRVLRSALVTGQFGPGRRAGNPADEFERIALTTGKPVYEVLADDSGKYLRAVIPARGSHSYLGKDCLGCHQVAEGSVLGAVSLEISLARTEDALAVLRRESLLAGLGAMALLVLAAWFAITRSVSSPLLSLSDRLRRLASGRVDRQRLNPRGSDEIAEVARSFDAVLGRAQEMLREERIAGDVFEYALEGICVTDADANIVRVNPAFTRTTGYTAEEVVGRNPRFLQSGRQDPDFYAKFWRDLTEKGQWQGDIWNRRKDGEEYAQFLTISRVCDDSGKAQNYVAVFSDITERKRKEARLRHRANHDALTGLPNRALFGDRLEQALAMAQRLDRRLAVMFIDLDRFKAVNDTLGHDVGDELLRQVAGRLKACVRQSDTVARMGGDEFTVLLPSIGSAEDAVIVGEKILEATSRPYEILGKQLTVTTSVGMSLFPDHGEDAESLLSHADSAMYKIKGAGRAGMSMFDSGAHPAGTQGARTFG